MWKRKIILGELPWRFVPMRTNSLTDKWFNRRDKKEDRKILGFVVAGEWFFLSNNYSGNR